MGTNDDSLSEDLITPEMKASFISETNDLLDSAEGSLLAIENSPEEVKFIDDAFRAVHTIKGNAGFFGYARIEQTCMDIESTLDNLRKGKKKADNNTITNLLQGFDSVQNLLHQLDDTTSEGPSDSAGTSSREAAGEKPAAEKSSDEESEADGKTASIQPEENGSSAQEQQAIDEEAFQLRKKLTNEETVYKPLGDVLVELGSATRETVDRALDVQQKRLGEILVERGAAKKEAVEHVLKEQEKKRETVKEGAYAGKRRDIRVDMNKLDKLFDLMGELITAEAMVVSHPELDGLDLDNFTKAASSMSKITRAMQEITMTIRMIPLEGLFNKMRRLVRDLSRKFGKQIELSISGQDTEMDRNVIDEISDPMVHLIRNSIDHGIEDVSKRGKLGKDETGHISLDAKYEGNEIWITISDDGGGLNREKIIDKAQANNLLTSDSDEMGDSEVFQLIFEPGFSTADKVSEISGRGVGMDVVRRNIEKLRGKIDIDSKPGAGTDIILKIPLTLAIIDGIIFRVGTMQYSLPINDVVEFQKAERNQVTETTVGSSVLRLRDELIPIIKLYEFFSIESEKREVSEALSIVAQGRGKKVALMVDEIIGYQQIVIKPLPEYMEGMKAVAGCSVMGNGEVTLILDIGSLIREELD